MSDRDPLDIKVLYDSRRITGSFAFSGTGQSSAWDRLKQAAINSNAGATFAPDQITLPWPSALSLIREFSGQQRQLDFRFRPAGEAKSRIADFARQFRRVREAGTQPVLHIPTEEIESRLKHAGFLRRELKLFQLSDLQRLLALENGANFSVPGAGKTTVALALHILTKKSGHHLLVVSPKSAFMAWQEVVSDCVVPAASDDNDEQFTLLAGPGENIRRLLESGSTRFLINYDMLIQVPDVISAYLASHPVHLVLDEAHRMKAGPRSQRGAVLLNLASLPIRRDILTGTPMPQGPADLQSQLDFLWPGTGLGERIGRGQAPRDVLGDLYVRTTKDKLGLPKPIRTFYGVDMAKGQMAFYSLVRSEALREFTQFQTSKRIDLVGAKRSVMRLLQLSVNPVLALNAITDNPTMLDSGVIDQVLSEGPSTKMLGVANLARELATKDRKSVIWTIFTDTIEQMQLLLADLNPEVLHGGIPTGDPTDLSTREGKIRRIHEDPSCFVIIANPAAAGEGINLHHACHDAIYLDRSYNTAHYLQSIDRIHRLGLPFGIETNIHIFQTRAPSGLGCIDHSVSRRLARKVRALQVLLNDPDLHEIALDEESAEEPIDYGIDQQDIIDLIDELEGRIEFDVEDAE
ncbi:MAG TPA: DEAD/DEAH box helicase [Rhizomicrobium sp.]|nr:DEAD/DEAH box helicase [Rhizomicrobium sp.]